MTVAQIVAKRLGMLLKLKSITRAELAESTGIKRQSISRYLAAEDVPGGENLRKLAIALSTTTDNILGMDLP